MTKLQTLALLSVLFLSVGCRSRDDRRDPGDGKSIEAEKAVQKVELIDKAGLQKLVLERNGKTLLLNIWATWCAPCVEEFPDLVRLSGSYRNGEVEVVGISVDFPDEVESKVAPFLRKLSVPFKVYVAKFDKQEDFINAVDASWSGAVPATFIYDSRGRQRFSFVGQTTYERFRKEIDSIR